MPKTVLSSVPDEMGYYYGFLPEDNRQINVRFETRSPVEPSGYYAYVGDDEVPHRHISKEAAEAAALEWMKKNPEETDG
jgi:hypothetical protein